MRVITSNAPRTADEFVVRFNEAATRIDLWRDCKDIGTQDNPYLVMMGDRYVQSTHGSCQLIQDVGRDMFEIGYAQAMADLRKFIGVK